MINSSSLNVEIGKPKIKLEDELVRQGDGLHPRVNSLTVCAMNLLSRPIFQNKNFRKIRFPF